MRFSIAPLLLVATTATTVLADGAAIIASINKISVATAKLNTTVVNFHDGILGLGDAIKLIADSSSLLNIINDGTKVATASANLTFIEAINVAFTTAGLVDDVINVITSTVNAKPKFDKLVIVSPVVLINLGLQRKASADLAKAIIAKVPAVLQPSAQLLVAPIDPAFVKAISVYNPFD